MGIRFQYARAKRPPLGRALRLIILANVVVFLGQLVLAYVMNLSAARYDPILHWFTVSSEGVLSGRVWQLFTSMWLHSMDSVGHILFNMLVLFWFGPEEEERLGSRRFFRNYLIYGVAGSCLHVITGLIWPLVFNASRGPALGASGAIAGVIMVFCLRYWRTGLKFFVFEFTGRTFFLIAIGIDVLRVVMGEPIGIESHLGGYAAAAILYHSDDLSPKLMLLRLKRRRLKRRLRLEPGQRDSNDKPYLH